MSGFVIMFASSSKRPVGIYARHQAHTTGICGRGSRPPALWPT